MRADASVSPWYAGFMQRFVCLPLLFCLGCGAGTPWATLPGPSSASDGAEASCTGADVIDVCTYAERADVFVLGEIVEVRAADIHMPTDDGWVAIDDVTPCDSVSAGLLLSIAVDESSDPSIDVGDTVILTYGASQAWPWAHRPRVVDGELDWGTPFDILAVGSVVGASGVRADDGTYVGVVGGLFVEDGERVTFDIDGQCQSLPAPEGTASAFVAELATCKEDGAAYDGPAVGELSPEMRNASVCVLREDG